jgi:ankyrin repeat protein
MCPCTSHIYHQNGYTPLHNAAQGCNIDVCKILLASGADARIKNSDGKIAAELIPNVDGDYGRELHDYFKKQEDERAELENTFKRVHVEDTNNDKGDGDI